MRAGSLAALTLVAAVLGGGAALGIGKGAGWFDEGTKTVVVNARTSQAPAALPARATSNVGPIPGKGFDPQRIFAQRSPGVVTIFAYFGDPSSETTEISQGSGFVISTKGYILTNSHVITNAGSGTRATAADHLYVEFADGDREEAKIVGWDLYDDVGLIRIPSAQHKLTPVPLGESAAVAVGQPVAAIGSPLGNENSLTVGVVSAIHRSIDAITVRLYKVVDAIQTDAPITHGNSGGPLFDARGRVIGINAQIRSDSGNAEGVGFAVPINSAKRSMEQLIGRGGVSYAYIGVVTTDLTPAFARHFHYSVRHGAVITKVVGDSPAKSAGLRGGEPEQAYLGTEFSPGADVIVAIDGRPVRSSEDVVRIVTEHLAPGQLAHFTVVRGRSRLDVPVRLGQRSANP